MPALAQPLPTRLRTTSSLRTATTQLSRAFSQLPSSRRSPSPPPPYHARNTSILASTTQWTRFNTTCTLSSVRTFTSSHSRRLSNEPPLGSSTSPEAAQKIEEAIEEIQELYGTARDEFEIAAEETEKNTTYAADDRAA